MLTKGKHVFLTNVTCIRYILSTHSTFSNLSSSFCVQKRSWLKIALRQFVNLILFVRSEQCLLLLDIECDVTRSGCKVDISYYDRSDPMQPWCSLLYLMPRWDSKDRRTTSFCRRSLLLNAVDILFFQVLQ